MKKKLLVIFLCLFVYCGVYLILTLNGRYEAGTMGLQSYQKHGRDWPKDYIWMPKYYVDDQNRGNYFIIILFLPLFYIDHFCWHTKSRPSDTDPVNPLWRPKPSVPTP